MGSLSDTLEMLIQQVPGDLRDRLSAFARTLPIDAESDDVWSIAPLRDLPGYAVDAASESVPKPVIDEARDAHHLGVLHAWHVERGDVDADDARLRGWLFERWRDALVGSARAESGRIVDRVTHSMRWMSWGLGNAQMARRAGRWTLQEYQRSLRWRTGAQGLASQLLVQRAAPGKRKAFERTYEQLVLGLAQTTSGVAPSSTVHQLLHCDRADLVRAGLLDIQLAAIDAEAAGFTRIAAFCRAHAAATEELAHYARESGTKLRPRSKAPTQPALKIRRQERSGEG